MVMWIEIFKIIHNMRWKSITTAYA